MVMTHDEEVLVVLKGTVVSEDTAGVYTAKGTRLDTTPQEKIELLEKQVRVLQEEVSVLKKQTANVAQPTKHILVDATNEGKMNRLRDALAGGYHVLNIDGLKFKLDGNINIEGEVTW